MLRRSLGLLCLALPLSAVAQWQLPPGTSSSTDDSSRQANPTSGANGTIATAEKRMEAQDWAGATQVLRPLVAREPNNAHAQYDMGFALDNGGDAAGAKAAYEAAAKADPTLVSARVSLGLLLARQGDAAAAARWLREATALPDEAASRPARAQAERALARLDLHSAPEQARDELLAAIRLSSEQRDDIELSGEIAEALQDDATAEQAYARVLAASSADPDATAAYARRFSARGQDRSGRPGTATRAGSAPGQSVAAGRAS